jgi:hypothetical protein
VVLYFSFNVVLYFSPLWLCSALRLRCVTLRAQVLTFCSLWTSRRLFWRSWGKKGRWGLRLPRQSGTTVLMSRIGSLTDALRVTHMAVSDEKPQQKSVEK